MPSSKDTSIRSILSFVMRVTNHVPHGVAFEGTEQWNDTKVFLATLSPEQLNGILLLMTRKKSLKGAKARRRQAAKARVNARVLQKHGLEPWASKSL